MKRILNFILILFSLILGGQDNEVSDANIEQYPKIGIALSGGGIRGIAHLGVLRRLEEEGVGIYMISGSSMGAMIGGLYSLGYDTYEIENIIKESGTKDMFTNKPERDMTENYIKRTSDRTVLELELASDGVQLPNALNNGHRVLKKIRNYVISSCYNSRDFDKLKYKLRIVCSDIQKPEKVIFREGDLSAIILGSMSFPGLFKPAIYKDMMLLDGGLTDNVPVSALEECDLIIASNTTHDSPSQNTDYNFIELLDRISVLMTKTNIESSLERADVVLRPDVEDISITELNDPDSLIILGYMETDKRISEIKRLIGENKDKARIKELDTKYEIAGNSLISSDEIMDQAQGCTSPEELVLRIIKLYRSSGYLLCDASYKEGFPDTLKIKEGFLKSIKITGDNSTRKKFIREELSVSIGKHLTTNALESSVDNLYGTGLFNKVGYELDNENCEVTFIVEEKPYNLIRLGANYQTDIGFLGLVELANKNLKGKRSEIYAGLTFGESFNRAELSYYNPFLKKSTLFFEINPYYQIKERNFYDTDHKSIEELNFDEHRFGAGFSMGFQFFDNYQGMVSAVQEFIDFKNSENIRTSAGFKILADSRNDHVVPGKGMYFTWNIETGMYDFNDGLKFQKTWWELSLYKNFLKKIFTEIGISGGTGDNLVPQNERYLVGGIKMMPGTFFEEYSVIQYFNIKNRYNFFVRDSTLFDLYISCGYYLNAFWENEPEIKWNYRKFINSFYTGIILNTTFAPVEAGYGLTAGNGKIKKNGRLFLSVGFPIR